MPKLSLRPTGANATIGRTGAAMVTSATGASITLSAPSTPGFNPLDLLSASVAGCLVLSARIAASEMGLLEVFEGARVSVTGAKAPDPPSRVEQL